MAETRAERRRQEAKVAKVISGRKVYREIASALRADARLIASYVERRSLELAPMSSVRFAEMMKAEIEALKHYDEPLQETP